MKSKNKVNQNKGDRSYKKEIFCKKLESCKKVIDLNNGSLKKDKGETNERIETLNYLTECLVDTNFVKTFVMQQSNLKDVIEVIVNNIFRPLPSISKALGNKEVGTNEEEQIFDLNWNHLVGVYELFYQLIVNDSTDVKQLKDHINATFIQSFLELFDSGEPKERDQLKNILHRLQAKLVPRRRLIRKAISDCFYQMIYEKYSFNGASELLDIMASIISGFAVPLREEHQQFFNSIIVPLHKVSNSENQHEQLLRCSMLFLSKDPKLSIELVKGLLKQWPFANSSKETNFVNELQEVIEVSDNNKLQNLIKPLFKRIAKCICGDNIAVSDRTLCFFENDCFLELLKINKAIIYPILVPMINEKADNHWHYILKESLQSIISMLKDIDKNLFEVCLKKQEGRIEKEYLNNKAKNWDKQYKKALDRHPNLKLLEIDQIQQLKD